MPEEALDVEPGGIWLWQLLLFFPQTNFTLCLVKACCDYCFLCLVRRQHCFHFFLQLSSQKNGSETHKKSTLNETKKKRERSNTTPENESQEEKTHTPHHPRSRSLKIPLQPFSQKKTTNPTTQKETRKITKKKWPNYTEEIRKSNADIYLSHFPLTSVVSEYVSNVSFSKRLKI